MSLGDKTVLKSTEFLAFKAGFDLELASLSKSFTEVRLLAQFNVVSSHHSP